MGRLERYYAWLLTHWAWKKPVARDADYMKNRRWPLIRRRP